MWSHANFAIEKIAWGTWNLKIDSEEFLLLKFGFKFFDQSQYFSIYVNTFLICAQHALIYVWSKLH